MALGKTITYTPFQETSFGYGSGEIAAAHATEFPNATDIVKVLITNTSGNWGTTGHISTPSVGTATAIYNSQTSLWAVRGERDDVDAVLAALNFFPADYSSSRTWTPIEFRDNSTSGNYTALYSDEEPPQIPDTDFELWVYDSSDTSVSSYTITWDADGPTYGNQRPYWSTEPTAEDLSGISGYGYIDLGVISHGTDTDNVQVKGVLRDFETTDQNNTYGSVTSQIDIYVADKKPVSPPSGLFDFTGSVTEAQTYLDNLLFYPGGSTTFDLYLTISDGVVGSEFTKKCWFSQPLALSTIPSQTYTEDQTFSVNVGTPTISNLSNLPDVAVGLWAATITLDATGAAALEGIDGTGATLQPNGDIRVSTTTFSELVNRLNTLEMEFTQDFDDSFTFDIVVSASDGYGSNVSSYTSATQTISVTGVSAAEVTNLSTSHTVQEEVTYSFVTYPQVVHPDSETFSFVFTLSDANAGTLQDSFGRITNQGSGVFTLLDTKANVNSSLASMEFIPTIDYETDFTISFTADRTTGDLTYHVQTTGVMNFDVVPRSEVLPASGSMPSWNEDAAYVEYDSGIEILDRATENPDYPSYFGTFYEVKARARYLDQTTGLETNLESINVTSPYLASLNSYSGTGKGSDPLVMIGTKASINNCLQQIRFIPDADFYSANSTNGDFWIEYEVIRQQDSTVYYAYSTSNQFDAGIPSDEFTYASSVNYGLEVITDLSNAYEVVDAAVNKEYFISFTLGTNAQNNVRLDATASGSATVNWNATQFSLEIQGNKQDINDTLNTLELIPFYNFNQDFSLFIYQYQDTDGINQSIGGTHIDFIFDSSIAVYTVDTTPVSYAVDTTEQQLFLGTTFNSIDAAAAIESYTTNYDVEYKALITIDDLGATERSVFFSGNYVELNVPLSYPMNEYVDDGYIEHGGSQLVYTGTQEEIRNLIANLKISGFPDKFADANIVVNVDRYINNQFHKTVVPNVTAIEMTSNSALNYTTSSQTQYIAHDNAVMSDNSTPDSKKLREYSIGSYSRFVNILDSSVAIGDNGLEYPAMFRLSLASTLPSALTYTPNNTFLEKAAFNADMDNGVTISVNDDTVADGTTYTLTFNIERTYHVDPETGNVANLVANKEVIGSITRNFVYVKSIDFYDNQTSNLLDTDYLSVRQVETVIKSSWEDNEISTNFQANEILITRDGTTEADATNSISYSGTQNITLTDYTGYYKLELDAIGVDVRTVTINSIDNTYGLKNSTNVNFKKWNMYYQASSQLSDAMDVIYSWGYPNRNMFVGSDNYSSPLGEYNSVEGNYSLTHWDSRIATKYGSISIHNGIWDTSDSEMDFDNFGGVSNGAKFITWLGSPSDGNLNNSTYWDQAYYYDERYEQIALYIDPDGDFATGVVGLAFVVAVEEDHGDLISYDINPNLKYFPSPSTKQQTGWNIGGETLKAPFTHADLNHSFSSTPTGATNEIVNAYILEDQGFDTWTLHDWQSASGLSDWHIGTPKFAFVKSYLNNGIKYYQIMYGEFAQSSNLTRNQMDPISTSVSSVSTTKPSFIDTPIDNPPTYTQLEFRFDLDNNKMEYSRLGGAWETAIASLPKTSGLNHTDYRFLHSSPNKNTNKLVFALIDAGYTTVILEVI